MRVRERESERKNHEKFFVSQRESLTDWFDCFLLMVNPSSLGEVWVLQSVADSTCVSENVTKI